MQLVGELNIFAVCGLIGFASYLGAFGALQLGTLDGNGRIYAWLNVMGAGFVLISLYDAFNLASMLIQISWVVIGCIGLIRRAQSQADTGRFQPT